MIAQASQTISFGALSFFVMGDEPYNLVANASSGLPVSFNSSDASVAAVNSNQLFIMNPGSADITASQAGDLNYLSASNITRLALVTNRIMELSIEQGGENALINIHANQGRNYDVQFAATPEQVDSNHWQTLTVLINLSTSPFQLSDPMVYATRVYRLVRNIWLPSEP